MTIVVDVWTIRCSTFDGIVDTLRWVLDAEEQSRADCFYREDDRVRYVVSHAAVRVILGRYAGVDPASLRFVRSIYGKPGLRREANKPDIRFNLSHSHELAICAVTYTRELGVDIEKKDPSRINMQIAERFFSPKEIDDLQRKSGADRVDGFYNCWTRKEAYIKGRGEGLSIPLKDFDVSLDCNGPSCLSVSRIDPDDTTRWTLRSLQTPDGYVSALAVQSLGESVEVVHQDFFLNSGDLIRSSRGPL